MNAPVQMLAVRLEAPAASDTSLTNPSEGVETGEQLEVLRRISCHEAQGYYLAPPQPSDGVSALLSRSRLAPLGPGSSQAA